MLIGPEKLAELESKFPRVAVVTGKAMPGKEATPWEIVVRSPTRSQYKAFRARAHNPALKADAQELLARECVVWVSAKPDATTPPEVKTAFDALLEDFPAVADAAADQLGALAGFAVDESGK